MRLLRKLLPLLVVLLASCEVRMPDYVLSPDRMESFLYDYHLVQSMSGEYSSVEYKEKLYYSYIYEKHGIDKACFDSSMVWYNRYPKHLKKIYENLEVRLEAEVERLNNARATFDEGVSLDVAYLSADSAELWTSSKLRKFSSTPLSNTLAFSFDIPEDTTFLKGDSLSFSFTAYMIPADTLKCAQEAYASVCLSYADGTVHTKSARVDVSGEYDLPFARYNDSRPKSMSGFVYYSDNDSAARSFMLLSDISLVRIHPYTAKPKTKKRK